MARFLSTTQVTKKNVLNLTEPWAWLFEVQHSDTEAIRVTPYTEQITYQTHIYYPFPLAFSPFSEASDSRNPNLTITAFNASGELQAFLDAADGFVDKDLVLRLIHTSELTDAPALEITFQIIGATAEFDNVTWTLGTLDLYKIRVPHQKFLRGHCRNPYNTPTRQSAGSIVSRVCGYVGSLTKCDKTLNGPNGCIVHGDDEVTNGNPRLHPLRFGGAPGIPANR